MENTNTKQNNALEQALNKRYQALAGNKYNSKPIASIPESTTEEESKSGGKTEAISDYLTNSMVIGADDTGSTKERYRNELAKLGYVDEYGNLIDPEVEGLSHRLTAEGRAYSKDMTENGISEDTYDYARSMYDSYNLELEKDELAKEIREDDNNFLVNALTTGLLTNKYAQFAGKRIWTWAKEKWNERDFGEQQDDYNEQKDEEHTQEVNKLKVKAEQSNEKGAYWSISTPSSSESENNLSNNNEIQTNKEDFVIFDLEGKEITDTDLRDSNKIDEALSIMASTRESIIDSQVDPETGEFVESPKISAIKQMSYRDNSSNVNKVFNQTKSFFDLYSVENLKRIADSVSPEYKTLKDNEEFKLNAKDWTELQKEISNAFLSHRVIEKKLQETDPQDAVAISDLERQLELFDPNTIVARYMTNRLDDRVSWVQTNLQVGLGFTDKIISEIGGTVALCKVLATADYNSEDEIVEAVVNDADVRYWNNVATTGVYETEDSNVSGASKFAGWALGGVSHALKTGAAYLVTPLALGSLDSDNSMMRYARNNTTQQQVLDDGYMRANKGATSWENENSNGWSAIFNENILGTIVEQTGSVLASALTTKGVGSVLGLAGKGVAVAGGAAAKGAQTVVGNGIIRGVGKVLQRSKHLADTGLFIEKQSAKLRNINSQLVRNNISKAMDKLTTYGSQGIGTTLAAANEGTMNGISTYDEVMDYVNESMDKYILDELDKYLKSGKASDKFKALSPEEQYQKVKKSKINKLASIERDGRSRARDAAAVAFATTTITNIGVGNMLKATTKLNNFRAMRDYAKRSRVSTHNDINEAADAAVRNSRTPKVFRAIQRGTGKVKEGIDKVKEYAGVPLKEFYEEWNPSVWGGGAVEASKQGVDAYKYSLINGLDIYQEGQWMAQSLGHFFGSSVENMASAEALSEGVLGAIAGGAQINPLYVFSYGSKVLSKERIQQARTDLQSKAENGEVISNFNAFRKNAVDSFKLFTEDNVAGLINSSVYNSISSAKTRKEINAEIEKQKKLYDDFLTASVQRAYCGEDANNSIGRSKNLMLNRIRQRKLAKNLIKAAENGDQDRFEELRNLSLFEDIYTIQQLSGPEIRAHRKNIEAKANYEKYGIKIDASEGIGRFIVNENFKGNINKAKNIADQLNKELQDIAGNDSNSDVNAETIINSYKEMLSDFDSITEMQKQAYKDLPSNTPEYVIRDYTRDLFFNRYLSNKINNSIKPFSQDDNIPDYETHNYFRINALYHARNQSPYQSFTLDGNSKSEQQEKNKIEALKEILPPSDPNIEDSDYLKEVERYLYTYQGKVKLDISKMQVREHMENLKRKKYHKENGFLSTEYSKRGLSYLKKDLDFLRAHEFMYNAERYLKGEDPTHYEEDFVKKSLIFINEKILNNKNDGESILDALSSKKTKDISFMKGFISAMEKIGLNNTTPDGIAIYEAFSSLLSMSNSTSDKLKDIKENKNLSEGTKIFVNSINNNKAKQDLIEAAFLALKNGVNSEEGEYLEYIKDKCNSLEFLDSKKPFNHTLLDFLDYMSKKHPKSEYAKKYNKVAKQYIKHNKVNTDEDITNDAKQVNDNNDDVLNNQTKDDLKDNLDEKPKDIKQSTEEKDKDDLKQNPEKKKNDEKKDEADKKDNEKKVKIVINSSTKIEVEISESDKIEDIIHNFIKQIPEEHSLYNRIGYNEGILEISNSNSSINIPLYKVFLNKLNKSEEISNHIKQEAKTILDQIEGIESVLDKGVGKSGADNGVDMKIKKESGLLKVEIKYNDNDGNPEIHIAPLPLGLFYSIENRFEEENVNEIKITGTITKHTFNPKEVQSVHHEDPETQERFTEFYDMLDQTSDKTIHAKTNKGQSVTNNYSIYVKDKRGTEINLGIDLKSIPVKGIADVLYKIYIKSKNKGIKGEVEKNIKSVLENILKNKNDEEAISNIIQSLEKSESNVSGNQEFIDLLQETIELESKFSIIKLHSLCFNDEITDILSPTEIIGSLHYYGMNISLLKVPNNNITAGYSIDLERGSAKDILQNSSTTKNDVNVFGEKNSNEQQSTELKDVKFTQTGDEKMPNVIDINSESSKEFTPEEIANAKKKLKEIKYIEDGSEKDNDDYIKYILQAITDEYDDYNLFFEFAEYNEDLAKDKLDTYDENSKNLTVGECSTGGCR